LKARSNALGELPIADPLQRSENIIPNIATHSFKMRESRSPQSKGSDCIPTPSPKQFYTCGIPDLKPLIQLLVSDTTDFDTISVLSGVDEKAFSLLKAGRQVHLTYVARQGGSLRTKVAETLLQQGIQPFHAWKVAEQFEFSTYELPCVEDTLFSVCQSILTTAFALPESQSLRIKLY
jgi:hypothetical protein